MKLNAVEKLAMNNPVRALLQRWHDLPALLRLGGSIEGARVLEVGCGRGEGIRLLLERGAARVDAFDLDPDMVRRARERLSTVEPGRFGLQVGDVTAVPFGDGSFDAVFDFGILHHVPGWSDALREVRRVLVPGGRFLFYEPTRRFLDGWIARTFTVHPDEGRFTPAEFRAALGGAGLDVGQMVEELGGRLLVGVARRPQA
jgi:ubiquinone/menaquinone biosynthesis C-methylase UbiE